MSEARKCPDEKIHELQEAIHAICGKWVSERAIRNLLGEPVVHPQADKLRELKPPKKCFCFDCVYLGFNNACALSFPEGTVFELGKCPYFTKE